jgi:uncharacterized membrane protein YkvI
VLHHVVYGFLNNCSKSKNTYNRNLIFILLSSILFSQIRFTIFVNYLYPILGIVGISEISLLIMAWRKKIKL